MTAVAVCNDSPQVADGTALAGCSSVTFIDSSELPSNLFSGVTIDTMAPVYGAMLLSWAAAWGIRKCVDVLGV